MRPYAADADAAHHDGHRHVAHDGTRARELPNRHAAFARFVGTISDAAGADARSLRWLTAVANHGVARLEPVCLADPGSQNLKCSASLTKLPFEFYVEVVAWDVLADSLASETLPTSMHKYWPGFDRLSLVLTDLPKRRVQPTVGW